MYPLRYYAVVGEYRNLYGAFRCWSSLRSAKPQNSWAWGWISTHSYKTCPFKVWKFLIGLVRTTDVLLKFLCYIKKRPPLSFSTFFNCHLDRSHSELCNLHSWNPSVCQAKINITTHLWPCIGWESASCYLLFPVVTGGVIRLFLTSSIARLEKLTAR